ncbi:MAG TPA: hypothetical protein VIL05_00240 [Thermoclostridium sp.]
MKRRAISLLLLLVLVLSVALTGCGTNSTSNTNNNTNTSGSNDSGKQNADNAGDKTVVDEKPVPIKWVGNPTGGLYPDDNSLVVKEIEKRFNVDIQVMKANSNKPEEMNLLFASGEIPDHILIRAADINMILEEGLVRGVSEDMLKEYAPTYYERVLENHPYVTNSVVYDAEKKVFYAIPQGMGELFPFTVIRTDWLEKVGAKMPTNLEEFEEICRLFTEEDPDGNGKKDTYAFSVTNNYDVYNLAATYGFSLPGGVVKDESYIKGSDGRLRRAEVTEGYKELLKYVSRLYSKGYIYPDVTIKDDEALFTDGVVGIKTFDSTYFIVSYRPNDWFALTFKKNPNAKTEYMRPLKGYNGEEAVYEYQSSVWRWQCFGKNTTDEQVKKILQIIEAQLVDMEFHNLIWRGIEGEHFTVDESGMAIAVGDWGNNEKIAELGTRFFICNLRVGEQRTLAWGRESEVQREFQESYNVVEQLIPSGTPIAAKTEYGADVEKIEKEFFLNTITGVWDVEAEWDNYLARWYKAGGQKIEDEVNDIYYNKLHKN